MQTGECATPEIVSRSFLSLTNQTFFRTKLHPLVGHPYQHLGIVTDGFSIQQMSEQTVTQRGRGSCRQSKNNLLTRVSPGQNWTARRPPGKTRSHDSGFPPQAPWITFPILSQSRQYNFPSQGTQDTVILVLPRALVSPGTCDRGRTLRIPEPGGPTDNLVCALPSQIYFPVTMHTQVSKVTQSVTQLPPACLSKVFPTTQDQMNIFLAFQIIP